MMIPDHDLFTKEKVYGKLEPDLDVLAPVKPSSSKADLDVSWNLKSATLLSWLTT